MQQIQLDALMTAAHRLPEIAKQLKLMNELRAWELKYKYHELYPPHTHAKEIDDIMEKYK